MNVLLYYLLLTIPAIMASEVQINPISESLEIGTRPHWDAATQSLYFVDIPPSKIYKYHPATATLTSATVGNEPLSFAFPIEGENDKFIAALGRKLAIVKWDGISKNATVEEVITEVDADDELKGNRLNGGKVDPYGRLWAGTMGPNGPDGKTIPKRGSLYSLAKRNLKKHVSEIGISNGLAWNTKTRKMYYIDTLFPGVYQYDYEPETGNISNRKVVFEFAKHNVPGLPDGLLIDADDKLWVAAIHGSRVIRVDPDTGDLLQTVVFPTPQVTAITFGGQNLDTLFVTTARITIDGKTPEFPAGVTYEVKNLAVKGLPGDNFKL